IDALHVSGAVHELPSLHGAVLLAYWQPLAGLQVSSVQTLPSLQLRGDAPTQVPPAQVSTRVHALLSLHGAVLFVYSHPLAGLQTSSVQPLPSSQLSAAPLTHVPPPQVSATVQALPSSHGTVLFVYSQPLDGLQVSSVHRLPSLQLSGAPL